MFFYAIAAYTYVSALFCASCDIYLLPICWMEGLARFELIFEVTWSRALSECIISLPAWPSISGMRGYVKLVGFSWLSRVAS